MEEESDDLDGLGGLDEDTDNDFELSVGGEDDDFVPESIPDPFGQETSDDLDMGLGDLDEDGDFGDLSLSDDLDDMGGLDDLGEATSGDTDDADLDALGLGDDADEEEDMSGFLSDFK